MNQPSIPAIDTDIFLLYKGIPHQGFVVIDRFHPKGEMLSMELKGVPVFVMKDFSGFTDDQGVDLLLFLPEESYTTLPASFFSDHGFATIRTAQRQLENRVLVMAVLKEIQGS
ncbi:MAG: hypothetical protein HQL52_04965 [Magnetococcales bacterium]|nr:hypothetical protein [Magnetococcales bacterium]